MTITEALGTSTPTSMTVVATKSAYLLAAKSAMTASFSSGFVLPCTTATGISAKSPRISSAAYSSAEATPGMLSPSSIIGQTINACLPAAISLLMNR